MMAIHKALCVDCYRTDHERVYGVAAPELPDRGMDPNFFALQQQARRQSYAQSVIEAASGRPLSEGERRYLEVLIRQALR